MATANRGRGRRPRRNYEVDFENGVQPVQEHPQVAKLAEELFPKQLILPITTRGIGMTVSNLINMSSPYFYTPDDDSSDDDEVPIPVPDIYALYRLFLGLLEYKLDCICINTSADTYRYEMQPGICTFAESIQVPKPIQRIINSVGVITNHGKSYVPVVAKDVEGVPRPENLLLSNLRRAVELLSNPETLLEHRKYFYEHNPIPGARWNKEEYLLLNPDDIIETGYKENCKFENDYYNITYYLKGLHRYSKRIPEFACGYINFKSNAGESLLISHKMATLRVSDRGSKETSCYRCTLEGYLEGPYIALQSVKSDNMFCLLGECPEPITCNNAVYNLRKETVNGFIANDVRTIYYYSGSASALTFHSTIPLTLSVTTRGIGISICHLVYTLPRLNSPNIPTPDIYAFYRLCLGLLEVKLSQYMYTPAPVTLASHTYRYLRNADLKDIAQDIWIPKQILNLINAVGKFQHEGITYVPAVAKDVADLAGEVPRPENLLLSNLRRAVELLSNPATPVEHRKYFYEHNPIPGAQWDKDNYLLLRESANQIIQADYITDLVSNFQRDCEAMQPFLNSLYRYCTKMPGLACSRVDLKSNGKKFLLISNQIGKLKVPDRGANEDLGAYCRKCLPEGDLNGYYALSKMSGYEVLLGSTSLLGERPEPPYSTNPVYDLRCKTVAGFQSLSLHYKMFSNMINQYIQMND